MCSLIFAELIPIKVVSEINFFSILSFIASLNSFNTLDKVSLVASKVNENEYLPNMPRNKSFTTVLNMKSNNQYISPMVYIGESNNFLINQTDPQQDLLSITTY